ncbi:MAG: polysaccharide biosynthesis/export family protein [Pseudomonadota bacterium]
MTSPLSNHHFDTQKGKWAVTLAAATFALSLAGCSTLGASGPSTGTVRDIGETNYSETGIQIVDIDGSVASQLAQYSQSSRFSEVFDDPGVPPLAIDRGDVIDVVIWEAPPAVLFGATASALQMADAAQPVSAPQVAQNATIPQQMVNEDGRITVPFVGEIPVVGKQPAEVERAIVKALRGKAHDPQVVVRVASNQTKTVTVLGEVAGSQRMPLTPRGERLLDALASAGGTRQPIDQTLIQLTRGVEVETMPLLNVIGDPLQNVRLSPDDVVTVLHRPFSFVALGSVRGSAEVPFEGSGLTLAQALGRVGGLNDRRADVRGVFLFRLEEPDALGPLLPPDATRLPDGRVPVVYRLDMSEGASLFAIQQFAMRDDDVLYVSTAPGADLQRFVSTISAAAFSIIGITDAFSSSNN